MDTRQKKQAQVNLKTFKVSKWHIIFSQVDLLTGQEVLFFCRVTCWQLSELWRLINSKIKSGWDNERMRQHQLCSPHYSSARFPSDVWTQNQSVVIKNSYGEKKAEKQSCSASESDEQPDPRPQFYRKPPETPIIKIETHFSSSSGLTVINVLHNVFCALSSGPIAVTNAHARTRLV